MHMSVRLCFHLRVVPARARVHARIACKQACVDMCAWVVCLCVYLRLHADALRFEQSYSSMCVCVCVCCVRMLQECIRTGMSAWNVHLDEHVLCAWHERVLCTWMCCALGCACAVCLA